MNVIHQRDVNTNEFSFSNPIQRGNLNLYYSSITNNGEPIYLQTNRIKITNASLITTKNPFIELSCIDEETIQIFEMIDNFLIESVYNNINDWFGQEIPKESIQEMYKSLLKHRKKIRLRVPIINNSIRLNIYDDEKVSMNLNEIKEHHETVCIIHLRGLKFLQSNFICDCYINQCKVYKNPNLRYVIPKKCLIKEDILDDDNDILDEQYIIELKKQQKKVELEQKKKLELDELNRLSERIKSIENDIKKL